jgi:glutamate formiminotransferase
MSEQPHSYEGQEAERISRLINALAEKEGTRVNDFESDIKTFRELFKLDPDAGEYLKEVAEKLDIPVEKLIAYAETLG